jgi:hypothetical protein
MDVPLLINGKKIIANNTFMRGKNMDSNPVTALFRRKGE